jgi:hypothetical protein
MSIPNKMTSRSRRYRFWLKAVLLFATAMPAEAQNMQGLITSGAISGGTRLTVENSNIKDKNVFSNTVAVHKNPSNIVCLSTSAFSRAQIVNPNIYENIVLFNNACSQPIKVILCFFASTSCITPTVDAYRRQEFILGLSSASKGDFRFQYREIFN